MKPLRIRAIPVTVDALHPFVQSPLPRHEFSLGIVAPKGSGKTTLIANLLDFYKGYFHNILIFSPTINNDEKWDWVRKQPLLAENTALKSFFRSIRNSESAVVQSSERHVEEKKFSPFIPDACFMTEYNETILEKYMKEQQSWISFLKAHGKTKHLANRMLFVFDDMVGSSLFTSRKVNPFKTFNTNMRHYSASAIEVTQAYCEVPRTVRINWSAVIFFSIANQREVQKIYEENPLSLPFPEWMELYEAATHGEYDFLYLNYQLPKALRAMRNFDTLLQHKPS